MLQFAGRRIAGDITLNRGAPKLPQKIAPRRRIQGGRALGGREIGNGIGISRDRVSWRFGDGPCGWKLQPETGATRSGPGQEGGLPLESNATSNVIGAKIASLRRSANPTIFRIIRNQFHVRLTFHVGIGKFLDFNFNLTRWLRTEDISATQRGGAESGYPFLAIKVTTLTVRCQSERKELWKGSCETKFRALARGIPSRCLRDCEIFNGPN